ncbi:hypothetical protein [Bartonella sp. HY038]|uniref:hypothetical protein n=1 Tax=Bartonella sp. HY038 TaxID=2759660 RepID=UPI001FEE10B4|nr:hypothetical protein [Bartonella sp. HY038]
MFMNLREQLITVSDLYGKARGIGRMRVSTIVLNQGSKLDAIACGKSDVTTKTFEKAMVFYSQNWPDGVVWPEGILRPAIISGLQDADVEKV